MNIKGVNLMSYTTLVKKWKKESERKDKLDREERKRQQAKAEKFQDAIYIAKEKQQKQERIEQEEKQQRAYDSKKQMLEALQKNNPFSYKQYLILWDIINNDYNQIVSDINRGHITAEDIIKIIIYVEGFSNEIITEYWKERLTC